MQFFHLFSFVVAASYAAALPQPAGLSEKYSNNVDAILASGLEARSYQPGLNSYKELATSTLIKRRGDSLESPEMTIMKDRGAIMKDHQKTILKDLLETILKDHQKTILKDLLETIPRDRSENLASTIDSVGVGMLEPTKDGKRAGKKIGGEAGRLLRRYMERNTYVNVALLRWELGFALGIFGVIESGLGKEKYSKVKSNLTKKFKKIRASAHAESHARVDGVWNILHESGSVIENVENIFKTATAPCYSTMLLLLTLKSQLSRFESGHTLSGHLDNAIVSIGNFLSDQDEVRLEIMKQLKARFPIVIPPTHPNSE
ncbi:hypothetical protein BASA60_004188 [Batrachochytrium salamandrivorans]|nr:hypothetical protein BASA60_004188 [Batrachochytrium salamandrivorans]